MAQCRALKPDGTPCQRIVGVSSRYCFGHDPLRQAERNRNASRAGRARRRGRKSDEFGELRAMLAKTTEKVLDGTLPPKIGTTAAQLLQARLRLIEIEHRVHDQRALEERLERLEDIAGSGAIRDRWGA
jgi:hypothetical protein